jgi:toxin ParE1/3/4
MLIWRPQAREDLLEIYILIGRENPDATENIYDSIETKAEVLTQYPRLGVRRANIGPSIRALLDGPYIIFYEPHPNTDMVL